jgi:hypothetical protein
MTRMTRKTLSLMAGALSLALAAHPAGRIDPTRIDGQQALLNNVGSPAEVATSIGGGRSVTGKQALLDTFAGGRSHAPASAPVSDGAVGRTGVQVSGELALLGR